MGGKSLARSTSEPGLKKPFSIGSSCISHLAFSASSTSLFLHGSSLTLQQTTMAGSDDEILYSGYFEIVPKTGWRSNKSENSRTTMSRAAYNDNKYKCSGRYTETHKAGDYVTRSGKVGYKEESRCTATVKYTDKAQGTTTEYQTQVNVKKVVYPSTAKASSGKRINYY